MKPSDEDARQFAAELMMDTALQERDPMRFNLMRVAMFLRPTRNPGKLAARSAFLQRVLPDEEFKQLRAHLEEMQKDASLQDLEIGETFLRLKLHVLESEVVLAQRALDILKSAVHAAERASEPEKQSDR